MTDDEDVRAALADLLAFLERDDRPRASEKVIVRVLADDGEPVL